MKLMKPPLNDATIHTLGQLTHRVVLNTQIDGRVIRDLYETRGRPATEEMICRILDDIAIRLDRLTRLCEVCDQKRGQIEAQRLSVIATQIGLTSVARASADLADCFHQGAPNSTAAVLGRLTRLIERSMADIWQAADTAV